MRTRAARAAGTTRTAGTAAIRTHTARAGRAGHAGTRAAVGAVTVAALDAVTTDTGAAGRGGAHAGRRRAERVVARPRARTRSALSRSRRTGSTRAGRAGACGAWLAIGAALALPTLRAALAALAWRTGPGCRWPETALTGLSCLSCLSALSALTGRSGLSWSGRPRSGRGAHRGGRRAGILRDGRADTGNRRNRTRRRRTRRWPGRSAARHARHGGRRAWHTRGGARGGAAFSRHRTRGGLDLAYRHAARNPVGPAVITTAFARTLITTAGRRGGASGPLDLPSRLRRVAAGERFLEPANHRRLDCRGRRTHELAHFFELSHDGLALYSELLREFVNPDLRHYAPLLGPPPGHLPDHQPIRGIACSGSASARAVHRLVLIERSLASRPAFRTGFGCVQRASRRRQLRTSPAVMLCPGVRSVKGTKQAERRPANP